MDTALKHVRAIKFIPGRNVMPRKLLRSIVHGARGTAQNNSFFFFFLQSLNAGSEQKLWVQSRKDKEAGAVIAGASGFQEKCPQMTAGDSNYSPATAH